MAPDRLSAVSGPSHNTSLGSPPQDTRLASIERYTGSIRMSAAGGLSRLESGTADFYCGHADRVELFPERVKGRRGRQADVTAGLPPAPEIARVLWHL
jgi:hypothetical protein